MNVVYLHGQALLLVIAQGSAQARTMFDAHVSCIFFPALPRGMYRIISVTSTGAAIDTRERGVCGVGLGASEPSPYDKL